MTRRSLVVGGLGLMLAACAAQTEPSAEPEIPVAIVVPGAAPAAATELEPGPEDAIARFEAEPGPEMAEPGPEASEPEEPAEPEPFEGLERVTVDELVAELHLVADELAQSPAVRADYEALVASHGLSDSDALYHDYVRVRLAFESTRDAGLWHLRWDITNEKPNSEQIWRQWKRTPVPDVAVAPSEASEWTATGECDELSALFAFFAYQLGVRHVGLYWPTWNHVVAVWTVQSEEGSPVRIVVPTSQIFLTLDDSLGTRGFDPWSQKTIYEYRRRDVKGSHRIEAELARFFVRQARQYGGLSQAELQRLRNERDLSLSAAFAQARSN